MNLKRKSKYIISVLILFLICSNVLAQIGKQGFSVISNLAKQQEVKDTAQTKKKKPKKKLDFNYSVRVGVDLSKPIMKYTEIGYEGLEFVGDIRVSESLFIAGEYGRESQYQQETSYDFKSSGNYLKFGFDYNFIRRRYYLENMIYMGVRYAESNFQQNLYNYKVFVKGDDYWKEKELFGKTLKDKDEKAYYSWVELVLGFRTLLLYNLYAGFSVRFSMNISSSGGEFFPPQWVPGYVKVIYQNNFSSSFNYTLSYRIPIIGHRKLMKKLHIRVPEYKNISAE